MPKPNVLFIMADQQRFDTIASLGNSHTYTPNFDRLVERGIAFTKGYSTCPVCVPARYTVRTGCDPLTTSQYTNGTCAPTSDQADTMEGRCGPYLARRMGQLGYRTFGIGKFHTHPCYEDLGYDVHIHSEELYGTPEQRLSDGYGGFITREHPEFAHIEQLQGERTEMYYMPQTSPFPAELTVESWAADRAIEQLDADEGRPFFGLVSFIGPHPPFAPPVPFNRMYDPDRMPAPVCGDIAVDHMDDTIPWMNKIIWAEDVDALRARTLKARYYGEISYIDACLGRILDAVEARDDADNTLICFFADHGDHLGDHHAWQKESFFEASCHVPFLMSWPARLEKNARRNELVCLTDLFGIATGAADQPECRDGCDVLGLLRGDAPPRAHVVGIYGQPGTPDFKIMVRDDDWKYIFIANGGREQLFNVTDDPDELSLRNDDSPDVLRDLRQAATDHLADSPGAAALEDGKLREFPFEPRPADWRVYQLASDKGVRGFPDNPADVLGGGPIRPNKKGAFDDK
jgi:arylsulfatase A-like enzyme